MNLELPKPTITETLHKLHLFGYCDDPLTKELSKDDAEKAIVDFQGFNGLQQTGGLNEDTLTLLYRPRCGAPDMVQVDEAVCRWPDSLRDSDGIFQVRVRQNIYGLNPLTTEQEKAAFQEALASWNAVCGINLFLDDENQPNISSTIGVLGSGTLAISYLPCGASANDTMDQTFNRAVNWSYNLLVQVIAHEIGHAIGLSHGPSGALLQPTASGTILKPQSWDIQQAVTRYGPPKQITPPSPGGDGKLSVSLDNKIRAYMQEAGTFQLNLGAESTKVIIPSDNKISVTVTKPGEYEMLLIPKLSNVHI